MSLLYAGSVHKLLAPALPPAPIRARLRQLLLIATLTFLGLVIAWRPPLETVLLLGGAIFLILLLIKPLISLYLLIPIIPFSPLFSISVGHFKVGLMEIVLALGIIAWLLQRSISQTPGKDANPHRHTGKPAQGHPPYQPAGILLWPFLLFLGGVALSWLNALSIGASLIETIKWVEMLALYLFVLALLPVRHIKWVVLGLLLTGMAQAVLGLYQFIFKVGPEGFLLFGGHFLRAYGTFAQPNPYAGYLGLVLPLSLSLAIWSGFWILDFGFWIRSTTHNPKSILPVLPVTSTSFWNETLKAEGSAGSLSGVEGSKIFDLILFSLPLGLLLMALFASQSRGAWLGFTAAAVVTFTVYNKKTAMITASVILVAAIIALFGAFDLNLVKFNSSYDLITQRLVDALSIFTTSDIATVEVNDANFAMIERLAHWQAAREMWRDNLWLGVGFGNYAVVYPAYAVGRWLDPLGHAHNYLLNIGAETGLVGITAYLIFWIFTFGVSWTVVRRSHGFYKAVAAGGLGVMVHLHVHNLFDNLYVQGMYLHIAIILGLISVIYRAQIQPTKRVRPEF